MDLAAKRRIDSWRVGWRRAIVCSDGSPMADYHARAGWKFGPQCCRTAAALLRGAGCNRMKTRSAESAMKNLEYRYE